VGESPRPGLGLLTLRLIIQPTAALILAIRAELKDAREGWTLSFWAILSNPAQRHDLLGQGWKDVGKVFILAAVLDTIYQYLEFRWFYPGEALAVTLSLAMLSYLLIRGAVTRLAHGSSTGRARQYGQMSADRTAATRLERSHDSDGTPNCQERTGARYRDQTRL
jgi:hypothetical protein